MPSLSLDQIEDRLRSQKWKLPTGEVRNLYGSVGKEWISKALMKNRINAALEQWAMELQLERKSWILDDGSGGEGTLTIGQRKYALPTDMLVMTEARVDYNDLGNHLGYELILTSEPFLSDDGTKAGPSTNGLIAAFAVAGISQFIYTGVKAITLNFPDSGGTRQTFTFASLGTDIQGLTPPITFEDVPFVQELKANADADIFRASIDKTEIVIGLGIGGSASTPFTANLTLGSISASLGQAVATENRPERMFIWQDVFYLDPVPNDNYTLRMFGYRNPTALSAGSSVLDTLSIFHESIFDKAKLLVARELNVTNEAQIHNQYADSAAIAKRITEDKHSTPRFTSANTEYWS